MSVVAVVDVCCTVMPSDTLKVDWATLLVVASVAALVEPIEVAVDVTIAVVLVVDVLCRSYSIKANSSTIANVPN